MSRELWVVEVNNEPLDQGGFVSIDDAYQAADEARQELLPAVLIEVVKYVPAKGEESN